MTENKQQTPEEKKKNDKPGIISTFLKYFFCKKLLNDLKDFEILYLKSANTCSKYPMSKVKRKIKIKNGKLEFNGDVSTESPLFHAYKDISFKRSLYSWIFRILLITYILLLTKFGGLDYLKYVATNFYKFLKLTSNFELLLKPKIISILLGFNVDEFKTFVIPFLILFFIQLKLVSKLNNSFKKSQIFTQTELFRKLAISSGFVTEERSNTCLWTPIGLYMDLEKGDAKSFAESKDIWTQLSMTPGKADKNNYSQHQVFVNIGFELPTSIKYELDFTKDEKNPEFITKIER